MATEQCSATLEHHQDKVQAVAWNPAQPSVLLSAGFDQAVCLVSPNYTIFMTKYWNLLPFCHAFAIFAAASLPHVCLHRLLVAGAGLHMCISATFVGAFCSNLFSITLSPTPSYFVYDRKQLPKITVLLDSLKCLTFCTACLCIRADGLKLCVSRAV